MAYRDTFDGFIFAPFSTKNVPVVVALMIKPSLIESSMFFPAKTTYLCTGFFAIMSLNLKYSASFW